MQQGALVAKSPYPEIWFRGLTEQQKEEFNYALSSSVVTKRLSEIVRGYLDELTINRSDYDNPAWAYRQADYNGEHRAYTKILTLLDQRKQND